MDKFLLLGNILIAKCLTVQLTSNANGIYKLGNVVCIKHRQECQCLNGQECPLSGRPNIYKYRFK